MQMQGPWSLCGAPSYPISRSCSRISDAFWSLDWNERFRYSFQLSSKHIFSSPFFWLWKWFLMFALCFWITCELFYFWVICFLFLQGLCSKFISFVLWFGRDFSRFYLCHFILVYFLRLYSFGGVFWFFYCYFWWVICSEQLLACYRSR